MTYKIILWHFFLSQNHGSLRRRPRRRAGQYPKLILANSSIFTCTITCPCWSRDQSLFTNRNILILNRGEKRKLFFKLIKRICCCCIEVCLCKISRILKKKQRCNHWITENFVLARVTTFTVPGRFAPCVVSPHVSFRPLCRFAPIPVRPGSFRPYSRSPRVVSLSFINSALKNNIWKIPLQIFVFWML